MKVNICLFLWIAFMLFCCQSNPYDQGKRIYEAYCASCHMEEGQGLKGLYPPLAKSDYLLTNHDKIACIIRHGLQDTIIVNGKTYEIPMMPISGMNEVQITNVINYISNAWGNNAGYTKITEVKKVLSECEQNRETSVPSTE